MIRSNCVPFLLGGSLLFGPPNAYLWGVPDLPGIDAPDHSARPMFYNNNHNTSMYYHLATILHNFYLCTSQFHHCVCVSVTKGNKV